MLIITMKQKLSVLYWTYGAHLIIVKQDKNLNHHFSPKLAMYIKKNIAYIKLKLHRISHYQFPSTII
jgi:hypothetical protein